MIGKWLLIKNSRVLILYPNNSSLCKSHSINTKWGTILLLKRENPRKYNREINTTNVCGTTAHQVITDRLFRTIGNQSPVIKMQKTKPKSLYKKWYSPPKMIHRSLLISSSIKWLKSRTNFPLISDLLMSIVWQRELFKNVRRCLERPTLGPK